MRAGGPAADRFNGLVVLADGTAFVTGSFIQTAAFAGLPTLATASRRATRDTDILVARLSPANAWEWAVSAGESNIDAGQGLVADNTGRLSVTGFFRTASCWGLPRSSGRARLHTALPGS